MFLSLQKIMSNNKTLRKGMERVSMRAPYIPFRALESIRTVQEHHISIRTVRELCKMLF